MESLQSNVKGNEVTDYAEWLAQIMRKFPAELVLNVYNNSRSKEPEETN